MKRSLLAVALAAALFALPSSANTSVDLLEFQSAVDAMRAVDRTLDPPPTDGNRDFVVGGFQTFGANWAVSAHSDPSGREPFGHVNETIPEGTSDAKQGRWRVTCLAVIGNRAALGLTPSDARSNDAAFGLILTVVDSGLPGGNGDLVASVFGFPPEFCPVFVGVNGFPIERGNILVRDSVALP